MDRLGCLLCVASPLLGARVELLIGIRMRPYSCEVYLNAHITFILLRCYTWWHGDGVWDYSTSVGLSCNCVGSGCLTLLVLSLWSLSFLDVRSVES